MSNDYVKIGQYILTETLGSGTFGKVKVGIHEFTGHNVAIKIINRQHIKSLNVVNKIRREIQNLRLFRHPHIIKLYQVISTPSDIFMIMEYVQGGEVFDYILRNKKLDEIEARMFFQQIISGVEYCHRHMVIHRDLKPENLLLDAHRNIKIADFGLSNMMMDGEFLRTSCGSPNYAAPEVVSSKMYAGPEVDVWSCGIILYAMLCGTLPFDDKSVTGLFKKIKLGEFLIPSYVNVHAANLIRRMLKIDPMKRATIPDIKRHEWFIIDLPEYLFPPNNDLDASVVDMKAVHQVSDKCQVSHQVVMRALLSGDPQDQLSIAYHLIVDSNKQHVDHDRSSQQMQVAKDFFLPSDQESAASGRQQLALPHPERMPRICSNATLDILPDEKNKKSRWHLGIRSQSHPFAIMQEIYRSLKRLNYEWKIINNFNLRTRTKNAITDIYTKVGIQLYQIDQRSYLVDFRNLTSTDHPDEARVRRMIRNKSKNSKTASPTEYVSRPTSPAVSSDGSGVDNSSLESDDAGRQHQVIDFLEMCAKIINNLTT